MKLKHQTDRSLESFKLFPFIAWGVTLAFAVFVFNIATQLQKTADQLAVQASYLEAQTKQVDNLDLERY